MGKALPKWEIYLFPVSFVVGCVGYIYRSEYIARNAQNITAPREFKFTDDMYSARIADNVVNVKYRVINFVSRKFDIRPHQARFHFFW